MSEPTASADLLVRLHRLASAMGPTARDTVEVSFKSSGRDGALIITDAPRTDEVIRSAVRCSTLDEGRLGLLFALIERLPSDCRRAVRLVSGGGVSLYWERRFTTDEQVRAALAAGQPALARLAEELAFPALGVACQQGPQGQVRMRLYMALGSAEGLVKFLEAAPADAGLPRGLGNELVPLWRGLKPAYPVLVNLSCSGEEEIATALKLEFPQPKLGRLSSLGQFSEAESETLRKAMAFLEPGSGNFNFLGVRMFEGGRRELTYYVEADHLLDPDTAVN